MSEMKTPEQMRLQSMERYARFIEVSGEAERAAEGEWLKPQGFEDWQFIRIPAGFELYDQKFAIFREMGYQDAPEGTRWLAAGGRDERGRYLCAPPEVVALRREKTMATKAKLQNLHRQIEEAMLAAASSDRRVKVQTTSAEVGTGRKR